MSAGLSGQGGIRATLSAINHATGREIVANENHGLATAWQASSQSLRRFLDHEGFRRFELELPQLTLVRPTLQAYRGRAHLPPDPGDPEFGPPPTYIASAQRYNFPEEQTLYLADTIEGVIREIGGDGTKIALRAFSISCNGLQIANVADLDGQAYLAQVFWLAERSQRSGTDFSRWVGQRMRRAFDGMIVRGVRGNTDFHYRNIVMFAPGDKWQSWIDKGTGVIYRPE